MKAIYMPKGKAGEYAKYAVNFYVGCSNGCEYCYLKRGVLAHTMGGDKPVLKKCFKDHSPYGVFIRELHDNIVELRKHGLFFTFTSDPLLPETQELNNAAVLYAVNQGVPCKFLTKRADFKVLDSFEYFKHLIAYGFTLTGFDELEPNATNTGYRIMKMKELHDKGFKTFASIEPIIDLGRSADLIDRLLELECCDLFLIGLMSGKRNYTKEDVKMFVVETHERVEHYAQHFQQSKPPRIYWKNSVLDYIGKSRAAMMLHVSVDADYNIFI